MSIVIDIGSATYGGDASIPYLVEEYRPVRLFGFDPNTNAGEYRVGTTIVREQRKAAWTKDGPLRFTAAGLGGRVEENGRAQAVGFDLVGFILDLREEYPSEDLILKLDCEGAEYELVPHIVAGGAAAELAVVLVEWHCADCLHGIISADDSHPANCPQTQKQRNAWKARRDLLEDELRHAGVDSVERWGR